jgi:hypothetical protein
MGMMVFYKLAVQAMTLACRIVVLQIEFTVAVMVSMFSHTIHIGSMHDVFRWSAVVPFFVCMLLTSMFALKDAPMSLIITFRAASPWLTLAAERFFPNPTRIGKHSMMALLVMLMFVCLYARDLDRKDENTKWALCWVALNALLAVAERLLQRLMLSKDQAPVDISKTGVSVLNNFIGIVPLIGVAIWLGEPAKVQEVYAVMSGVDKMWVLLSCVAGVGISFTAIWAQSLISATSMLVLTNSNKFVVILLEMFVMPETKKLTAMQIVGAFGAIAATVMYSKAREFEIAQEKAKNIRDANSDEKEPLVAKKV